MNQSLNYIMDDHREDKRLLDKVDAPSWISKYLEPHLQDARTVLSVGCGPGVFLRELAAIRPNAEFVGVDLSAERIHEAETRLRGVSNARVQIGDAQALPFESGSFDFVFCRFLLEYLPDKQRAVEEMVRICRGGGRYCSRTWTDSWYGTPLKTQSYSKQSSEWLIVWQVPVLTLSWGGSCLISVSKRDLPR